MIFYRHNFTANFSCRYWVNEVPGTLKYIIGFCIFLCVELFVNKILFIRRIEDVCHPIVDPKTQLRTTTTVHVNTTLLFVHIARARFRKLEDALKC
jgi:hypothetical protein